MPRLVQVAQRAADFAATTAFYADLLGVEPVATFDPPGLAFFIDPEGSTVGLVEQRPRGQVVGPGSANW